MERFHVSALVMFACVVMAGCVTTDVDCAKTQTAMSASSSPPTVTTAGGEADRAENSVKARAVAENSGKKESRVGVDGKKVVKPKKKAVGGTHMGDVDVKDNF